MRESINLIEGSPCPRTIDSMESSISVIAFAELLDVTPGRWALAR
jgi:hypothetical protein